MGRRIVLRVAAGGVLSGKNCMDESESAQAAALRLLLRRCGLPASALELLREAVTHRSAARPDAPEGYDRLEFLGDRVIDLVVAEHLVIQHRLATAGDLTRWKQQYVNETALALAAERMGLFAALITGKSEQPDSPGRQAAVSADLFESVTAAIYLTLGLEGARTWIRSSLIDHIDHTGLVDFKSALQELLQEKGGQPPVYRTECTGGPSHAPEFRSVAWDSETALGEGRGGSKKEAEQNAARRALQNLGVTE